MLDYLHTLNHEQRKAVEHTDGPILILAGAGAGKTKTITHRILHLIHRGVEPDQILAITFTNKAAREMRERVNSLVPEKLRDGRGPFLSTFHALGAMILRENAQKIGLTRHFTILDRGDSLKVVKDTLIQLGYDPKQFEPRKILAGISRAKGDGKSLETFFEVVHSFQNRLIGSVWEKYDATLRKEKALDFDDLLFKMLTLLRENPDLRSHYQTRWNYIHVDEYQDTNGVQYEIIQVLGAKHRNICVVGDLDQSIYSWRGATIDNILSFEKDYPDAAVHVLEQNYRSTKTILAVSNDIIEKNIKRRKKRMFTDNADGESVSLFAAYDEKDEAAFIATKAKRLIENGVSPKDIAVLYRTNFQSRAIEEACLALGIPYHVIGTRFFERKEVKDVMSFIRAALNPGGTNDIARIANVPPRGIGKVTLLKMLSGQTVSGAAGEKVRELTELLRGIENTARSEKPSATLRYIVGKTGLDAYYKKGGNEDLERLKNIEELATIASSYDELPPEEGILAFLEHVALHSDQDDMPDKPEGIALLTVHAAKGLEFSYVFITGLEAGLFPIERDPDEDGEEERRLFYVALTRAKQKLFLSFASARTIFGSRTLTVPSEFLSDIDPVHLVEEERPHGLGKVIYLE